MQDESDLLDNWTCCRFARRCRMHQACVSCTNGSRRRHLLAHSSVLSGPDLRHQREVSSVSGTVMLSRTGGRNLYLRYYSAAFASFRAPIPTSPLSASRLPTHVCGNDTGLRLFR